MFPITDKFLNLCLTAALAAYVGLGVIAAFLITDDFDQMKLTLTTLVGLPSVTIFCLLTWWTYGRWSQFTWSYYGVLLIILVSFSPGVLSVLNAVTGESESIKQSVGYSQRSFIDKKTRGGFGFLYKYRF